MRMVQAGCVVLAAALMLCCSGCTKGALVGASTFAQNPKIALEAVAQLAAQAALARATPEPTASPTPCPTPIPLSVLAEATATPAPTPTPAVAPDLSGLLGAVTLIPNTGMPSGTGSVVEQHYPNGTGDAYIPLSAGSLRNMTNLPNAEVEAAIAAPLPFEIEPNSAEPQVLIMHTHATETYRLYEGLYYNLDDTARTTDKSLSVCAVGAIMTRTLNEAGINTLHDTTLNDYPSYNASYGNSHEVVAAYLAQYPSIKVVLDVHRDALQDEQSWYAPVAEINGQQAAQVMIIAGCDNGGSIVLPDCMKNLAFAAAWQAEIEGDYAGLTRSAMFKYKYYNQDLTTGSLLIEVGGHGNTLNEALYAGQLAAQSLVEVLTGGE